MCVLFYVVYFECVMLLQANSIESAMAVAMYEYSATRQRVKNNNDDDDDDGCSMHLEFYTGFVVISRVLLFASTFANNVN